MIGSLSIQLPMAKGSLTLSGNFNAFDLIGDERALVFALLDLMQDFEATHTSKQAAAAVAVNMIGWRCDVCHTRILDTAIDLGAVVCGCGLGKGRWGVEVSADPPSQGKEGR
jgi:hypothetical protein